MDNINLQQLGGFPLETDTLDFMQKSYTALQMLAALGGDNYILSGCIVAGANVTDGWVVINGQLLPFKGGLLQTKVVIREVQTLRPFEDGANRVVFLERNAQFGSGEIFVLFSDLVRIKDLKTFRNLPHEASSAIDSDVETTLATSKAVKLLNDKIGAIVFPGMILIWSGSIGTIPNGWMLCDGIDGRPDLRDKFVLGAGNMYAIGQQGGEKDHILTVAEMPSHNHTYQKMRQSNNVDGGSNTRYGELEGAITSNVGGGLAHNNMPPYYSLAYIIKL